MPQGFSRWLRIGLLTFFGVLLLCVVLAYTLVDTRKVAGFAANAVEKATGRSLALNGPIALHFFPRLSVVAEDVVLGNPPWAADPAMVKADRVSFSVAWKPLLHQQIVIEEVQLKGVVVNLQTAPAGQKLNGKAVAGNWQLPDSTDASGAQDESGGDFDLKSVNLTDITLGYRDGSGNVSQSLVVDQLTGNLTSTEVDFSGRVRWQQQPLALTGRVAYPSNQPLRVDLKVQADRIDLQSAHKELSPTAPSGTPGRLFDTQTLGFNLIPVIDGAFDVAIKTLVLPSGIELPGFATRIKIDAGSGGVMTLQQLSSGFGQGVLNARGQLNGYSNANPQLTLRGHAQGFSMDKLIAQIQGGSPQKSSLVQGGAGQMAFNLNASGNSTSALASTLNGQVQMSVGPARMSKAFLNSGGDFAMSLLDAINPVAKSSDFTQLQCAVAYLPIRSGIMAIDRSVGLETDRLNLVLDGQVNLKNENLSIKLYPKEKSGLTTGVNVAGLVQINGTLMNPKIGVNKTGVASQAANVGLAVVTGGISLAAQNVMAVSSKGSACQNVLRSWSSIDDQMVPSK